MAKKKLEHFAENKTFKHYFEMPFEELSANGHFLKDRWRDVFFCNQNPLVLEIGCGKGEYTVGQAEYFPNKNFIGIDIKGARIWRGSKTIQEKNIKNAAFIRSQVGLLQYWFAPAEVDEIWITFPDPQPGARKNKRLTSTRYITMYSQYLKKGGVIHLKTDSRELFDFTLEEIEANNFVLNNKIDDLYTTQDQGVIGKIQTHYEKIWLAKGKTIMYVSFQV